MYIYIYNNYALGEDMPTVRGIAAAPQTGPRYLCIYTCVYISG